MPERRTRPVLGREEPPRRVGGSDRGIRSSGPRRRPGIRGRAEGLAGASPRSSGYLCSDLDEMVAAVGLLAEIDRYRCRFSAEERFSVQRMARDNEHLYLQLLARARQLPAAAGSTDRGPSQVVSFDPARKRSRAMAMGRGRRSVGGVSSPGRPSSGVPGVRLRRSDPAVAGFSRCRRLRVRRRRRSMVTDRETLERALRLGQLMPDLWQRHAEAMRGREPPSNPDALLRGQADRSGPVSVPGRWGVRPGQRQLSRRHPLTQAGGAVPALHGDRADQPVRQRVQRQVPGDA
jgi:hypothetical protein